MTLSANQAFWNHRAWIIALLSHLLTGCIGLDAHPVAARAGDTVTLALGSPDGMTRSNTTVSFEDVDGGMHDLTANVRGIFKLYPDRASAAWDSSLTSTLVTSARHEPWLTVMALDLPQSLPAGVGRLHINSTAAYPGINAHINDVPVRLEILPGSGTANQLEYVLGSTPDSTAYGDITLLEPRPSVAVRPADGTANLYGAIEMKLRVETNRGTELSEPNVRVVMEDLTVATESRRTWFWNIDNGQDYTITLVSPLGWLTESEARFKIVFKQAQVIGTPAITSIRYFDVDGTEIVGPAIDRYTVVVENG